MCGIAGFLCRSGRAAIDGARLAAMGDALAHRGPDGAGQRLFDGGAAGLAHRRLAILDLTAAAAEPIPWADERYWLTFNGEIYNYAEIRDELRARGCTFRSTGDAEVVVAAYAEWGEACVERFRGMWAFAVYDTAESALFASRDRIGIKPLYYADDGDVFVFASEIRGILASGQVAPAVNPREVAAYLAHGEIDGSEDTLFEGVHRLPAAHSVRVSRRGLRRTRYWELHAAGLDAEPDPPIAPLAAALDDAVRCHLLSDVPVGVSLSGGLDSGAITAMAAGPNPGMDVYSAWFDAGERYDERGLAKQIADMHGARHHEVKVDPARFFELFPKIVWHLEEPPLAHGVFARWHVCERASRDVAVLLVGAGGDELFAGYDRHDRLLLRDAAAARAPRRLAREITAWGRRRRLRSEAARFVRRRFSVGFDDYAHARSALGDLARDALPPAHPVAAAPLRRGASALNERLRYEVAYRMLPTFLRYDDKLGMAFSVECRVPLLDHRLVELAFSLSPFAKIRNGWRKWALRRALDGRVPETVRWRREKAGYPAPFAEWLGGPIGAGVVERVLDGPAFASGFLDRRAVEETLGRGGGARAPRSVWRWLALSTWLELHARLDERGGAAPAVRRARAPSIGPLNAGAGLAD